MEENKTSLLNLISSVIGIIIVIQLIILAIVIDTKLNDEEYGYGLNFGNNWNQGPISSLDSESSSCPIGSTYGLVQTYFPGFKSGCYCPDSKTYFADMCSIYQNKSGCSEFPETSPKLIVSWGGSLCTDRSSNSTYFSLNRTINEDNTCTEGMKDCGFADTLNSKLCVSESEDCPVNYLKIVDSSDDSNSEESVSDRGFKVNEVSFASGQKKFIYSNENNKGKVVNEFMITDHKPCADSIENKIELYSNNDEPYSCQKNVSGFVYDPSWTLLDSMTVAQIVHDNNLNNTLEQYPFWPDIKNRTVGLYYRNYIGLNDTCFNLAKNYNYPNNVNTIPLIFNNMKSTIENNDIDFISLTSISIYIILLISLFLKVSLAFRRSKVSHRLYINITAAFCNLLLLIVGIVSTINISNARNEYIWFYNYSDCSDPIDQGILELFDSNIKEAYTIAVVFTIFTLLLFFIIIIEYLLKHCYEENDDKIINKKAPSDETYELLKNEEKRRQEEERKSNTSSQKKKKNNKDLNTSIEMSHK